MIYPYIMFIVEKIQAVKSASTHQAAVNSESRRECEGIMKKIYDENPSYWPYGLDVDAHDGGVYMIREASTRKPIGFTGWQEREEGPDKVGYYSIGILPEYRHNGYAKQAISKLISIKAATVDKVKALVMRNNIPSLALANSLDIPVVKEGSVKKANQLKNILTMLGTGAGSAALMDALTYGRDKSWKEYVDTPLTTSRAVNALANVGFGALAGSPGKSIMERLAIMGTLPAKDLALASIPAVPGAAESLKHLAEKPEAKNIIQSLSELSPTQKLIGGGLGLAGLLGAGYLGNKGINALQGMEQAQKSTAGGKIRVSLPTKDPNDEETTIELPMGNLEVSGTQLEKLQRDLRRRIRRETKERTAHRLPSMLMSPKEANCNRSSLHKINNLLTLIYG
jgi:RimJ/RimL family protein N-acetyltransferase